MLSLQSVHVEQFLPQGGQAFAPQTEKPVDANAVSFMDLLRAEQRAGEGQDVASRVSDEPTNPPTQKEEKVAEKTDDDAVRRANSRDEKSRVTQETDEEGQDADGAESHVLALAAVTERVVPQQPVVPVAEETDVAVRAESFADMPAVAEQDDLMRLHTKDTQTAKNVPHDDTIALDDMATVPLVDENALTIAPYTEQDEEMLAQMPEMTAEQPMLFAPNAGMVVAQGDERADAPADEAKKGVTETKNKPRIAVTDLRTQKAETAVETDRAVGKAQQKNGADFAFAQKNEPTVQMTMEMLGAADVSKNITSASTQTAAAHGSNFQAMLANAVQEHAPDFVKAGNIILRDGNQGAINVILRPESLGNVKISLSLSDKVISGQITVHSQEAYDAFKDSIDTLKAAFAQSGFEAQGFDLQFAGGQQFAQSRQDEWQNPEFAVRADRSYGDFVAGETDADAAGYAVSDYGVNIVA